MLSGERPGRARPAPLHRPPDLVPPTKKIQFRCECGRMLQAREEHAGLEAKCPSCERISTIPTAEEAERARRPDALQTDEPRRPRYDEPEDRPRRRRRESAPEPRTSTMATL